MSDQEQKRVLGKIDEFFQGAAPAPIRPATGQYGGHWILSEEDRNKGFVRPVRLTYKHVPCDAVTFMPREIAETYARKPKFYDKTFCVKCKDYLPIGDKGEFVWEEDGSKVGT